MKRVSIFILLCLFLFNLVNSCVDVLFVIDTKSAEVSKNRAIQVAKQLPEEQKIRKWIAISRQDRYVPRVVRNNNELMSVLSSVSGDYEKFLEVATSEVARRTPTFQPLIILLFSEVGVNETLSSTWKTISRAPALHIFRIGTSKKREIEETSEFQRLVSCGHNKTLDTVSSKFSGSQNEIRRAPLPSTTSRPLTSTRDPFVRKLTFLNPTKTLLHDKQFTVTRNFRRLATSTYAPTWRRYRLTTRAPSHPPIGYATKWTPNIGGNNTPIWSSTAQRRPFGRPPQRVLTTTRRPWSNNSSFGFGNRPGHGNIRITQRPFTGGGFRFPSTTSRPNRIGTSVFNTNQSGYRPRPHNKQGEVLRTTSRPSLNPDTTSRPTNRVGNSNRNVDGGSGASSRPSFNRGGSPAPTNRGGSSNINVGGGSGSSSRPTFNRVQNQRVNINHGGGHSSSRPNQVHTSTDQVGPSNSNRQESSRTSSRPNFNRVQNSKINTNQGHTTSRQNRFETSMNRGVISKTTSRPNFNQLVTRSTSKPWIFRTSTTSRPTFRTTSRASPHHQTTHKPSFRTTLKSITTSRPNPRMKIVSRIAQQHLTTHKPQFSSTLRSRTTSRPALTTTIKSRLSHQHHTTQKIIFKATTPNHHKTTTTHPPRTGTTPKITPRVTPSKPKKVTPTSTSKLVLKTSTTPKPSSITFHKVTANHQLHHHSSTPSPTVATVLSAPPPSLKEQFAGGKNFRVRSRSVQFTLTEKPPVVSHRSSVIRTHRTTLSPPTTTPFIPPACLIDVYFMIDLSKGTGDKTDKYLQLISTAINQMPISKFAIHAGLIGYSGPGRTRTDVYLDQIYEKKPLIEAMQRMWRNAGTTKTANAIRYAVREFASKAHPTRKGSKKILVIFTDGYSQDNPKEAAKMARSQGIQIIGVGLDDKLAPPDVEQLKTIAESNVLLSPTGTELRDKIVGSQCRL